MSRTQHADPAVPASTPLNMRVFVRIRPESLSTGGPARKGFPPSLSAAGGTPYLPAPNSSNVLRISDTDKKVLHLASKQYSFDGVFTPTDTNTTVYDAACKPLVGHAVNGYCSTFMCYGQTATGKTFTMSNMDLNAGREGVLMQAVRELYAQVRSLVSRGMKKFDIRFSYVEMYRDKVQDLLKEDTPPLRLAKESVVFGTEATGVSGGEVVLDATKTPSLSNPEDFIQTYHAAHKRRVVAETKMNSNSSRGHSVLLVDVNEVGQDGSGTVLKRGKMIFVDLAGYERLKSTMVEGKEKDEAKHINLSLSALASVIRALTYNSSHVPYRNSKLTRMLHTSLAGNSITTIVLTVTGSPAHISDTANTLYFGHNAIQCKTSVHVNMAEVNYKAEYPKLIQLVRQLEERVEYLSRENERVRNREEDADGGSPREKSVSSAAVEEASLRVEVETYASRCDVLEAQVEAQESDLHEMEALLWETYEAMKQAKAETADVRNTLLERCEASERKCQELERAAAAGAGSGSGAEGRRRGLSLDMQIESGGSPAPRSVLSPTFTGTRHEASASAARASSGAPSSYSAPPTEEGSDAEESSTASSASDGSSTPMPPPPPRSSSSDGTASDATSSSSEAEDEAVASIDGSPSPPRRKEPRAVGEETPRFWVEWGSGEKTKEQVDSALKEFYLCDSLVWCKVHDAIRFASYVATLGSPVHPKAHAVGCYCRSPSLPHALPTIVASPNAYSDAPDDPRKLYLNPQAVLLRTLDVHDTDFPRAHNVTIEGRCCDGAVLKLHYTYTGGSEATPQLRWFRLTPDTMGDELELVSTKSLVYRVSTSDCGSYIVCEVRPARSDGVLGAAVAVRTQVPAQSGIPSITNLRITGDTTVGCVVEASYNFRGGGDEKESAIRWFKSVDGQRFASVLVAHHPARSLRLTSDLVHHYLRVQVSPMRSDKAKGNAVVSKLVYVNVDSAADSRIMSHIVDGCAEHPVKLMGPAGTDADLSLRDEDEPDGPATQTGVLRLSPRGIGFEPSDGLGEALSMDWSSPHPLIYCAPPNSAAALGTPHGYQCVLWTDGDAAPNTTTLKLHVHDSVCWQLLLDFRAFFCMATREVVGAVLGAEAASAWSGAPSIAWTMAVGDAAMLQSKISQSRLDALLDSGDPVRPGSHSTFLAQLEEALMTREDRACHADPNHRPRLSVPLPSGVVSVF